MWVTDAQVKKMRKELDKDKNVSRAAIKAGMDRKTARRYRDLGALPSEVQPERTWRTRADPFVEDWPAIEAKLRDAAELDAKTLFEDLMERRPGAYSPGQLRTLQRRIRLWKAQNGPPKEVFFPQQHRPGEAMQTDFTVCDELGVTIAGAPFPHMLCHSVLPYSNWESANICHSESMASIKAGVQDALRRLGGIPEFHQTDNSTAATHKLSGGEGRGFNDDYARWMEHVGMKPRTTAVGAKEQNGDVEALNGALKRRLGQHLLLRGSRDFATQEAYETFLNEVLRRANELRAAAVADERQLLKPLPSTWYPEYVEDGGWVTPWSTVRVRHNTYSVPSRLIGERVRARVYDDRIEIWLGGRRELALDRLPGRNGHRIDYRHVVWSLVKKPGAFARYRYREDLYPTLVFRRAYDALRSAHVERIADREYVLVLHLAASTSQNDVEAALAELLDDGASFDADAVRTRVKPRTAMPPQLSIPAPDPASYDRLLTGVAR